MTAFCDIAHHRTQHGLSLITSLLFMVAALILGVSVMSTNVMQERMIGNTKDHDLALQAAEAALRDAEQEIVLGRFNDINPQLGDDCGASLCTPPSQRIPNSPLPVHQQPGFNWGNARVYGATTNVEVFPLVSEQPVYVIERLGSMPSPEGGSLDKSDGTAFDRHAYRITVRATGARSSTVVILQSIFG